MKDQAYSRVVSSLARVSFAAGLGLALLAPPTHAVPFAIGDVKGSFDTTFSFGGLYRLKDPNTDYYGTTNVFKGVAGWQNSANTDDGNLNYGKGWVSEVFKSSHELELKYGDYGALVRGYWFADFRSDDTLRTKLSDQAKDRVVNSAQWLDIYARGKFTIGAGMPLDLRIGRQVLSLGESTFIPNGNNVVNAVDLSKLRVPGAELKEAFLPVNMVKASIGLTPNVTLEPFWLLEFRRNELEPAGTYFSTNDFATRGGSNVFLGFGTLPDTGTLGMIPREKDRDAGNLNQFGLAARVLAPGLNNTEFGIYYARYNSRSPVISARTPTSPISTALVVATASNLAAPLVPSLIAAGIPAANVSAALTTLIGAALTGVPAAALPANLQPFYPSVATIAAGAGRIGLLTAAATGRYFTEYPEGINMFGASFNTSVGSTGISWQGEISLKNDVALQIDDVELLFATLSSLTPVFGANNQIGNYFGQLNREVPGYRRHNAWTAQTTLTKVFGPTLGAQQLTVLGEIGGVWANLPSKDVLRYDGPATFTGGNPAAMTATGFGAIPATPTEAFADSFSGGYQIFGRLDYNNVFPNVNLQPSVAFTHDVRGNTPLPLGNYIRGRKSINLALEFVYRNAWSLEMRYVNYFGAGRFNLLGDRDYFATTVKYSF
ncbi:MAG: DUF1302 domain-containing protein [Verrucomicrobia bacterium]|nr:DUF1302 domain-containing protein [Verrucomicrobiota bacterium]